MATLYAWQRISRVLSGQPFGDGSTGNTTISSDPNTRATASGTAGSTSLTIGSAVLSNGNVFAIMQNTGTGVGQWEINKVASGGGTTSITCSVALKYSYGTGAQVIKIPLYNQVTLGSFTVPDAIGTIIIVGKTSISGSGTINGKGGGGAGGNSDIYSQGSVGGGPKPGLGGGGGTRESPGGGGGGGNAVAGGTGQGAGTNTGGASGGTADLTNMIYGSGGGGGGGGFTVEPGSVTDGGKGAASFMLISKSVDISSASINSSGTDAANPSQTDGGAGGGGSGGSILIVAGEGGAILGTNKATALASAGGTNGQDGGAGSAGRIAVHHSRTVTGTTNPTYEDVSDPTLVENAFLGGMI